jgi:hypothetical protein
VLVGDENLSGSEREGNLGDLFDQGEHVGGTSVVAE